MTDLQELPEVIIEEALEKTAYAIIENIPKMLTDINKMMSLLYAIREKTDLYINNLEEIIKNDI